MSPSTAPVLRVEDLTISYKVGRRWIQAVRDFHVEVRPRQIYGVVGESGSGKSTVAAGIMRYLPANGRLEPGSRMELRGEDLSDKPHRAMRRIWGARMNLVPQNPGTALNPSIRVGEQVAELLRHQLGLDRRAARARVVEMFERVDLADPASLLNRYPHELSGGMQQRVLIAMALATSPDLLILDEPTTALDVTTEATILDLVRDLITGEGAGALYITHNLGVVAQLCERVVVLYAGEIMEDASVEELFRTPRHPYTIGLLNSVPRLGQTKRQAALQTIAGRPPSLLDQPQGCVYAPRCPLAIEICRTKPPLEAPEPGRLVRCHRWEELARGEVTISNAEQAGVEALDRAALERERLLQVTGLTKHYQPPRGVRDILRGTTPPPVRAVDGVNLSVQKGRTLGLVGESGSGKTTLARVIIGLTDRTAGEIELLGFDVSGTVHDRDKRLLAQLQMVFQNPQDSLNPYRTVGQALRRPLLKLAGVQPDNVDAAIRRLLADVNLPPEYADRYPAELSGGEKQRVAIARAFASEPALILCDEPVSSLDVSVQAAVLNLLARLQEERDTAYLFISHDLAVVGYLADYLVVMYLGAIYEVGYGSDLFSPPYHPYTEALVSAIPRPDPDVQTARVRLEGEIPSPRHIPTGCRFHTRCPHKVGPICEQEEPPWQDAGDGHYIRCHREPWDLAQRQQVHAGEDR